jgi:restriction system protein
LVLTDIKGQHITKYCLIFRIQRGEINLYNVQWREFEKLVAELLHSDGWKVELRQGTKDGGVDILAMKTGFPYGDVLTLWQAKWLGKGRKVGIDTIRELADTRNEFKASKGIIVTSSYLTGGAIKRIERDAFILGKVDPKDLSEWIRNYNH